jgi:hypothetical protein
LLNVALAWESLQHLVLDENTPRIVCTNFSLACLIPLAKYCPELSTLRMAFNARPIDLRALYGVNGRKLQSLHVYGDSTILHSRQVTRSLTMLFPSLKSIDVENVPVVKDQRKVKR